MAKNDNLTDFLTDVADAIREKKGTTDKINPQSFSEEIRGIESGGGNATIEYADTTIFGKDSYKKVVIHDGVESIGQYSFCYATNIEEVTLPSSIKSIGDYCFNYSTIRKINIPDTIEYIGKYAFSKCSNLEEYIHPRSINVVPERLCDYCHNLKYVYFPKNITNVKSYAFYFTSSVSSDAVFVVEDVYSWVNIVFEGVATQPPLPNHYMPNAYFSDVNSIIDTIVLDEVVSIEFPLFRNFKNIKGAVFSDKFTSLGDSVFNGSSIENVELGNCTNIGNSAFYTCYALKTIDISNVEVLGNRAFYSCSALSSPIKFNPAIEMIDVYMFFGCTSIPVFDFRNHTSIPTLSNSSAFQNTKGQFVVPDDLYDEWIAATNWSTYASRIVKASEYVESTTEE